MLLAAGRAGPKLDEAKHVSGVPGARVGCDEIEQAPQPLRSSVTSPSSWLRGLTAHAVETSPHLSPTSTRASIAPRNSSSTRSNAPQRRTGSAADDVGDSSATAAFHATGQSPPGAEGCIGWDRAPG